MIKYETIPRLRRATQMIVAAQVDLDTFLLCDDTPSVALKRKVAVIQERIDSVVEELACLSTSEAARAMYEGVTE